MALVTIIPSLQMVVAVRGAKQSRFEPGNRSNSFNQLMSLLSQATLAHTSSDKSPESSNE